MDVDQEVYILKSEGGNGPEFRIPKDSVGLSRVLSDLEGDDAIELNFSAQTLSKILEYLNKYKNNAPASIERPLRAKVLKEVVSEWDAAFVELEIPDLYDLLCAAHLLDIAPLVNLCGAKVATLIDRKNAEQIREVFGLTNDLTPEQQESAKKEYHSILLDEIQAPTS
eukprot:CAMPEP_0202949596 /NCGR_PEP_ID=MMETSP1395-20130829/16399_1 /ASSEMBLY_ACC=CAM_ASM_000871 /TAXON_ID=5961 /ORGANISM="Blepharisma japonicum, Strain Stock R1072" /LENGTH=167 /DNA_ID=CAMNT_0049652773 /DNA_START=21 /DNA_END=524 /DNA_ORIENTATION=+